MRAIPSRRTRPQVFKLFRLGEVYYSSKIVELKFKVDQVMFIRVWIDH